MEKEPILRRLEAAARRDAGRLAGELARADAGQREALLAEFEYHRWLMECHTEARRHL